MDPFTTEETEQEQEDPFGGGVEEEEEEDIDGEDAFEMGEEDEEVDNGFADSGYADLGDQEFDVVDPAMPHVPPNSALEPQQEAQQISPVLQGNRTGDDNVEDDAALRNFERKWAKQLEEKDAKMQKRRNEMKEAAEQELEQHFAEMKNKLEARKKTNREEEKEFVERIDAALTTENPWERILSLVDINQSDLESKEKDMTRVRRLFLQLKQEGAQQ